MSYIIFVTISKLTCGCFYVNNRYEELRACSGYDALCEINIHFNISDLFDGHRDDPNMPVLKYTYIAIRLR